MKSQWVYLQIFSNLDMIAVFFLYILKSYKEKNLVEWIKAFSTLLRKKLFFVWLQLRVLSEINNEGEIKWTGLALTSKRNIWRIEQPQSVRPPWAPVLQVLVEILSWRWSPLNLLINTGDDKPEDGDRLIWLENWTTRLMVGSSSIHP